MDLGNLVKYMDCIWLFLPHRHGTQNKNVDRFSVKIEILFDSFLGFPYCLMYLGNLVKYMDCIWLFLPNRHGIQNKNAERFSVRNLDITR